MRLLIPLLWREVFESKTDFYPCPLSLSQTSRFLTKYTFDKSRQTKNLRGSSNGKEGKKKNKSIHLTLESVFDVMIYRRKMHLTLLRSESNYFQSENPSSSHVSRCTLLLLSPDFFGMVVRRRSPAQISVRLLLCLQILLQLDICRVGGPCPARSSSL